VITISKSTSMSMLMSIIMASEGEHGHDFHRLVLLWRPCQG